MLSSVLGAAGAHKALALAVALGFLLLTAVGAEAAGLGPTAREVVGVAQQSAEDAETDSATNSAMTALCHLPGGDASKGQTLYLDGEGVTEHLAHGDVTGECDEAAAAQTADETEDDEAGDSNEDCTAVCHVPGGDASKARTLYLDDEGVAEHLAHGDASGECDDAPITLAVTDDKVAICHVPGGQPEQARTLVVGEDALADHLGHGDTEGECDDDEVLPSMQEQQLDTFCERKPDHRRCG